MRKTTDKNRAAFFELQAQRWLGLVSCGACGGRIMRIDRHCEDCGADETESVDLDKEVAVLESMPTEDDEVEGLEKQVEALKAENEQLKAWIKTWTPYGAAAATRRADVVAQEMEAKLKVLQDKWTSVPDQYANWEEFGASLIDDANKFYKDFEVMLARAEAAEVKFESAQREIIKLEALVTL